MLVRLMYASRAADSVNQEALAAILTKARSHNPTVGVTGVLCVSDGLFLQVPKLGLVSVKDDLPDGRGTLPWRPSSMTGTTTSRR